MITLQDVEIIECGGSDDVAAVDCDCSGTNSVTAVSRFRTSNLALNLTDSVAVTDVTVPPDINREFCLEQEIGATEDYCTWRLNDAFSLDITYGLPCDDSTGTDLTAETSLCTVTRSYDIVLRKRDNNQFELTIQTAITAEHNSVVFRGAMFTLNDLCNQSLSFVNDLTGEGTICSGSGDTTVDEEIGADGIAVAIACCS